MRTFSANFQNMLDLGDISYFFLIELNLTDDFYLTSLPYDVVYDGNTYVGDGGLFEVDSPRFSTVVDREAYKIVITDLTDELLGEFRTNVIGKSISVKLGLLDTNNEPMLNPDDVVFIYKGYIDSPVVKIDWEKKLATIEGTSPMADLDGVNVLYSSKDSMDMRSLDDTTFDGIYDDEEITIKWGKK